MTILSLVQRVLGVHPDPVTHNTVTPSEADRDQHKEFVLRRQQEAILNEYNHAAYLRKELAASALRIVAVDR